MKEGREKEDDEREGEDGGGDNQRNGCSGDGHSAFG